MSTTEKLLIIDHIDDKKAVVTGIHYIPFHETKGLTPEIIESNVLVETVSQPEVIEGKYSIHYVNPKTKEQWFEYVDIDPAPDNKVVVLEAQVTQLTLALAELGAASEQDKIETQLAIAELASLLTGGNE